MKSHAERAADRKKVAAAAKKAGDLETAARLLGLPVGVVRYCCNYEGVRVPALRPAGGAPEMSSLRIIAALRAGRQQSSIARSFRVSRQWVGQLRRMAIEAGLLEP